MKKRTSSADKSNGLKRERVDRKGRSYDDFNNLSLQDKARVVQIDSVEGFQENIRDILSLHLVRTSRSMCRRYTAMRNRRLCGSIPWSEQDPCRLRRLHSGSF